MTIWEAYKTWPEDVRAKLSCHDLRRMAGWSSQAKVGDWAIDNSAGRPILVYQKCSVIEAEQAEYAFGLIVANEERQVRCADFGGCVFCDPENNRLPHGRRSHIYSPEELDAMTADSDREAECCNWEYMHFILGNAGKAHYARYDNDEVRFMIDTVDRLRKELKAVTRVTPESLCEALWPHFTLRNDRAGLHPDIRKERWRELVAAALQEAGNASTNPTVCWQHRPGAPCPWPESCKVNGCSAVERDPSPTAPSVETTLTRVLADIADTGDGPFSKEKHQWCVDQAKRALAALPQDGSK